MNVSTKTPEKNSETSKIDISKRIVLAYLVMIIALTIPILIIQYLEVFADQPLYQHFVQAIFICAVAVVGIWFLRSKIDKGIPVSIGLTNMPKAVKQFLLGFGLIAVPLIITVLFSKIFGWGEVSFNFGSGILISVLIGFVSTLFTDALTEELIFRGYIYSNLREKFNIWVSSLITLGSFVLIPIVIFLAQTQLGIKGYLGGSETITGGFIITMIFFGSFVQYLRILSKSIWVGVGFHTFFVHMNSIIGITDTKLVQYSTTTNQQPIQLTLMILLLIVYIGTIVYPIVMKRKNNKAIKQ